MDRELFRSYMTPEAWTELAQYRMGADMGKPAYSSIIGTQDVNDNETALRNFLALMIAAQEDVRKQRIKKKKAGTEKQAYGQAPANVAEGRKLQKKMLK